MKYLLITFMLFTTNLKADIYSECFDGANSFNYDDIINLLGGPYADTFGVVNDTGVSSHCLKMFSNLHWKNDDYACRKIIKSRVNAILAQRKEIREKIKYQNKINLLKQIKDNAQKKYDEIWAFYVSLYDTNADIEKANLFSEPKFPEKRYPYNGSAPPPLNYISSNGYLFDPNEEKYRSDWFRAKKDFDEKKLKYDEEMLKYNELQEKKKIVESLIWSMAGNDLLEAKKNLDKANLALFEGE